MLKPLTDDNDANDDDDSDDGLPCSKPGVSTWRDRNPDKPSLPLRTSRNKQSTEALASAAMKRKLNKETEKGLKDLDEWVDERLARATKIAEKHNIATDHVLNRMMGMSSFKPTRKANTFNAMVHHLMKRERAGSHFIDRYRG
jgi:hypothetical protein